MGGSEKYEGLLYERIRTEHLSPFLNPLSYPPPISKPTTYTQRLPSPLALHTLVMHTEGNTTPELTLDYGWMVEREVVEKVRGGRVMYDAITLQCNLCVTLYMLCC